MKSDPDLPDWVKRLPEWVRDDEVKWLSRRPWIAGFIEAADYTLNRAVERFDASQRRFTLRAPVAELVTTRGLETTSIRTAAVAADPGLVRHVKITKPEFTAIRGIAVPYRTHSTPVAVSGIVTIEQFDEESLYPIPPSCRLLIDHDPGQVLGRVTSLRHTQAGLAIEAAIGEEHRQAWLHRWIRGEHSSLSIGFAGAAVLDDWSNHGGLPLRTVRGARLVEVSVVRSPAYEVARITEVF